MSDAAVRRLAALVDELARAHRSAAPAPRGLPYLGLERASGTGFHLLDALAARGIFRKYELVLELGAGLGATSRWLAARLGCDVVGATGVAEAVAGNELTRRAGLAAQVRLVAAEAAALPFRAGRFTHVWAVESLGRVRAPDAALAAARDALRRGGTLAVQDLVRAEALADRLAALDRAGFTDVDVRDRTDEAAERSAQVQAARTRLLARLRDDPTLAPWAAERDALARALANGALRVVQIVARRP